MTDRMPVAYIAGKYRAKTEWELIENIREAERYAIRYAKLGFAVICPHKNTAHFGGVLPDTYWLAATMEMLRHCDVVVMIPNWQESEGAKGEHAEAQRLMLPIVYETSSAPEYPDLATPNRDKETGEYYWVRRGIRAEQIVGQISTRLLIDLAARETVTLGLCARIRDLEKQHDDLQAANTREVERRRKAEAAFACDVDLAVRVIADEFIHNGRLHQLISDAAAKKAATQ